MFVRHGRRLIICGSTARARCINTSKVVQRVIQESENGENRDFSDISVSPRRAPKKIKKAFNQIPAAVQDNLPGEQALENSIEGVSEEKPRKRTKSKLGKANVMEETIKKKINRGDLLKSSGKEKHHDLASFLEYSERENLERNTTLYEGTHYEYTVDHALRTFRITSQRIGGSNDRGIDLLGQWALPGRPKRDGLKIIIQCKASTPGPAMVRELEGACSGAPARWVGPDVLALLVTKDQATKGVREALQTSTRPLAFMHITREGDVKQFIWNSAASGLPGLDSLGVTMRYDTVENVTGSTACASSPKLQISERIALTWKGKLWRSTQSATA